MEQVAQASRPVEAFALPGRHAVHVIWSALGSVPAMHVETAQRLWSVFAVVLPVQRTHAERSPAGLTRPPAHVWQVVRSVEGSCPPGQLVTRQRERAAFGAVPAAHSVHAEASVAALM